MDSLGHQRVRGDLGSCSNSPVSVDGGQVSHAPSIHEQGQAKGGTIDILQQIAQALQRATQPATVAPQQLDIERIARYQPIDFIGKKDDEPSMAENSLERTERMLRQMHYNRGKFRVCDLTTSG